MSEIKIRKINSKTMAQIDKIIKEINLNRNKKISREAFLREQIEKIPVTFQNQKEETETSILIKKQIKLFRENLLALNVLAQYFIEGDFRKSKKGLELLEKLSEKEGEEQ